MRLLQCKVRKHFAEPVAVHQINDHSTDPDPNHLDRLRPGQGRDISNSPTEPSLSIFVYACRLVITMSKTKTPAWLGVHTVRTTTARLSTWVRTSTHFSGSSVEIMEIIISLDSGWSFSFGDLGQDRRHWQTRLIRIIFCKLNSEF